MYSWHHHVWVDIDIFMDTYAITNIRVCVKVLYYMHRYTMC